MPYGQAHRLSELSGLATRGSGVRDAYVGFYWTLPVPWAGFRGLPRDVDAAARASRTIGYQRERVRQHVQEAAGDLVDEVVFMDVRTDRATELVLAAIEQAARGARRATLVLVEFSAEHRWRPISDLGDLVMGRGIRLDAIDPRPVTIDGKLFDPIRHFADWRTRDASAMAGFRVAAHAGLAAALAAEPPGAGRWRRIATRLNGSGVRTLRGGETWTPEGVRKLASRGYQDAI